MGTPVKSESDLALGQLDDYLRGAHSDEQAHAYEEDLFARALAAEAPELGFRAALQGTLREMAARGTISPWLTAHELDRVLASGLRVRQFELDLARPAMPDLSGEFDLLVTKVPIDLSGVHRLDAEVLTLEGVLLKTMPDIAFDPADRAVYACCEAELARTAGSVRTITRVWAVDDQGRRLVSEITV